jgi:hypothetical protein
MMSGQNSICMRGERKVSVALEFPIEPDRRVFCTGPSKLLYAYRAARATQRSAISDQLWQESAE